MIRRGLLVLAAVLVLLPGTAHADGELVVSADGSTWSASLPGPVLGGAGRWVPGDVRTGGFWVRNDAAQPGTLSVAVATDDPTALVGHGDVSVEVRRDGGAWTDLPADGALHPLAGVLGAAAADRVEVRAVFRTTSPNRSQETLLALRFTVALARAVVAPPEEPGGPGLPGTGGVRRLLLVTGVVLVLAGLLLVGAGPRREEEEPHDPS